MITHIPLDTFDSVYNSMQFDLSKSNVFFQNSGKMLIKDILNSQ